MHRAPALLVVAVMLLGGCSLDTSDLRGTPTDGGARDTGTDRVSFDGGTADAGDSAVPDSGNDSVSADADPADALADDKVTIDAVPQDALQQDMMPIDTAPMDTLQQDMMPIDTAPMDTLQQDTMPGYDAIDAMQTDLPVYDTAFRHPPTDEVDEVDMAFDRLP